MSETSWGDGVQTREQQRKLKRQAILRVAASAFNSKGFHQTTLDDIAQALNVTKPTLYYYVKNKDQILVSILEEAMVQLRAVIQEQQADKESGYERLRGFFQRYAEVMTDDFGASLILTRISALESKFSSHYHTASREVFTAVQQMVRDGVEDGSLAASEPKYVASALLATVNETVYWYLVERKDSPRDSAENFFAIFEQGLLPRN